MKSRRQAELPLWFFVVLSALMIVMSFRSSHYSFIPEKILEYSALLSMPDVVNLRLTEMKNEFLRKYGVNNTDRFNQKSGSMSDFFNGYDFSDLSITPEDILVTTEKLNKSFVSEGYEYDGDVVDVTYINQQVTDSCGTVKVRNVTENTEIDIQGMLSSDFSLPVDNLSKPLVLIYHTHSTESYLPTDNGRFSGEYPTRNNDEKANMIRVGDEICAVLEAKGIGAVHDRAIYDKQYTGAYEKSRSGVEKLLEKYPSIIITLDIHRDAIYYDDSTRVRPLAEINGKNAAQMMIIAGAEGGNVSSFPSWETNLNFALRLQQAVNNEYENLMKPIYFCNRKYNMDVTPYSLLIEVGTDVNTLEQASYSARLLGDVLAKLIKENIK